MPDDFMIRAFLAGLSFAFTAGPMGCIVVWRRMAFFGDTLAHASLCGIALGALGGIEPFIAILAISLLIALLLAWAKSNPFFSSDTLLAIGSHGSLAIGILCVSLIKGVRPDLNAYLFGDILSVSWDELRTIGSVAIIIVATLCGLWRVLVSMTIAEDLATIEGMPVRRVYVIYMILLAIFVTISIKIVGVLLITALLILPPSIVQGFSKSPEQMGILSSLAGSMMVASGLAISSQFDVPAAPSIVLVGLCFFVLTYGLRVKQRIL